MGIDLSQIRELCELTLDETDFPELGERHTGKVRESYVKDGQRTLIVSDRVSCFDIVVGTIPLKGQVLNQVAAFWFDKTREIAPNHLLSVPDPSASITVECQPLAVEFVYRGYLTGSTKTSIWTAYERGDRSYCGHQLPDGLRRHEKLPEPLLTPTTKADMGAHDEVTSRAALIESGKLKIEKKKLEMGDANAMLTLNEDQKLAKLQVAADARLVINDTRSQLAGKKISIKAGTALTLNAGSGDATVKGSKIMLG